MLAKLVHISIRHRMLVIALAAVCFAYGISVLPTMRIDVLPDLNRPTVTIFTEAPGLSPEEVESLVSRPVETSVYGANGVVRVRSNSSVGLSLVFVEFDWGQDIYTARQIVTERLAQIEEALPEGGHMTLGPISSIMGNIMAVGLTSTAPEVDAIELRTLGEWTVRRRLLAIPGIAQITVVGGDLKQFQVLVSPERLVFHRVSVHEVVEALENTNINATGGFVLSDYTEGLVRILGRASSTEEISKAIVHTSDGRRITIDQLAEVRVGGPLGRRGDASVNGKSAVMLSIQKQPKADTLTLVQAIRDELALIQKGFPEGVEIHDDIFSQSTFINNAVKNVVDSLRDGAILVVLVLFLFLLNFRTTFITLLAIPLSLVVTLMVFQALDLSINTMTLGGLAIAIGALVDDAIVGVENSFRRLRENRHSEDPQPADEVVYRATKEIINSIFYATVIIILVFLPLFALSGVEGRIFTPLGIAFITAIAASLLVSLTVTPALVTYLVPNMPRMRAEKDGLLVRAIKAVQGVLLKILYPLSYPIMAVFAGIFGVTLFYASQFGQEFLPEFNEGAMNVAITMPPGTSLQESNRIATVAEKLLLGLPEVEKIGRRSGRAEQDEHVDPVNSSELEFTLRESGRSRAEILEDVRKRLEDIPGILVNVGQPLSHRIDHVLSGVRAQLAIKIFGDDLRTLRNKAAEIESLVAEVEGIVDLSVEQMVLTPHIHVNVDRDRTLNRGMSIGEVAEYAQVALNGKTVSEIIDGQQSYDLVVRFEDRARNSRQAISKLPVWTPQDSFVPLNLLASIEEAKGPNLINRENGQRRIIVQANVAGRDIVSVVDDITNVIAANVTLPEGYFVTFGGQFESQASAFRTIVLLGFVAFIGMFLVLFAHFKSVNFALQVMLSIPLSFIGGVIGVMITNNIMSIATIVGFITLAGIASRNGILMISHYMHLLRHEGESFDKKMITRGTQERIIPVLMTALAASLALIPLLLGADEPGREILWPVAVVIFSGMVSSTFLDLTLRPLVFWKFGHKEAIRLKESWQD